MSVKAVIDIGSNSIKLRVGRRMGGGPVELLQDVTEVVQLGKGLVDGGIAEETLRNAVQVIAGMAAYARGMGVETPCLVGTMILRVAANADTFRRRIREATGLEVQVLSGEEEARFSWRGALLGLPSLEGQVVLFDTGGGSTEFVFGRVGQGEEEVTRVQSVPIGAISLTERFLGPGPVRQADLDAAMRHIEEALRESGITCPVDSGPSTVVGVGGGLVAMASVKRGAFVPTELHGTLMTQKDLNTQIRLYSLLSLEERKNVVGLPPSRAEFVLGSACIVLCSLKALNVSACTLSINGLRHGVLAKLFDLR